MKIWVDDIRPTPDGYIGFMTTNEALRFITHHYGSIELIDLDHDAGDCVILGGDYINILNELERLTKARGMDFSRIKFRFHSANLVGVENMRRIIERNGWEEIK